MPLKYLRGVFLLVTAVCVATRVYLHLAWIDPVTGFYTGGQAAVWAYYLALGVGVFCLIGTGYLQDGKRLRLRVSPLLKGLLFACAAGLLLMAIPDMEALLGPAYLPNSKGMIAIRFVLLSVAPVASAILLAFIGFKTRGDSLATASPYLSFFPVLWIAALLLSSFIDYTASRHVSDQMLVISVLACATLFMLPFGRLIGGIQSEKLLPQLLAFGMALGLLALSVCTGILAGAATGPVQLSFHVKESVVFLLWGVFATVFVFSIKEVEPEDASLSEGNGVPDTI